MERPGARQRLRDTETFPGKRSLEKRPEKNPGWALLCGGVGKDEPYHLLRFATDTQRLADQARYISHRPARSSSQPLVSAHADLGIEKGPHMPTNP